jgi:hypothetical protein
MSESLDSNSSDCTRERDSGEHGIEQSWLGVSLPPVKEEGIVCLGRITSEVSQISMGLNKSRV